MSDAVWSALEDRELELGPDDAGTDGPWTHWRLSRDEDGFAWLIADCRDARVNTLSEPVLAELDAALACIEEDAPRALVIRSAKRDGFFAGADVSTLKGMGDASDARERLARAHSIVDRLAALPSPTIAVLHGHVLGGGLELALACDHCIVAGDAQLAFPEVRLGLHPALGGPARLFGRIDPLEAMRMMLTGKAVRPEKALSLGLVDAVTEERHVRAAVREAAAGGLEHHRRTLKERIQSPVLASHAARKLAADRMRAEAARKAPPEHYPAPDALIDLWEKHGGEADAWRDEEIESFARLLRGQTAQNLIRTFLIREKMKDHAGAAPPPRHVHVIGAGAMGGDIAAWCAWRDLRVSLTDVEPGAIAAAIQRAAALFRKLGRDGAKTRDALDRLIPDPKGDGAARADIVIEAAPEDLGLKRKLYAELEPRLKPQAVLATNTSSLPLEELRTTLHRAGRLIGLHFFNPATRIELVELVSHDGADADALATGRALLGAIDRIPTPVRSAPGFLVNRALTPYLLEALVLLEEGHAKETIDAAAERFGMPMGPIELADLVGLDVCADVADSLRRQLDRPLPEPPDWLRDKIEQGVLGKKSGEGLYRWRDGEPVKQGNVGTPTQDMVDRLILPMIDACLECLRKETVPDEEVVDGALVLAAGFAPFRGGPIHHARSIGAAALHERMLALSERIGERFRPDSGWDRLLRSDPSGTNASGDR
jgi:3-hydroxyacyl-CoA dehydrogenase / enoyl-CoA hydratase / 3-hydroxybutyryl-CoA epimerase